MCNYEDVQQAQASRGSTTGFQIVKGHFMNKITGVKEITG